ncbi:MAG: hypothetical protein ABI639_13125 [Thermoanaerobaculia bacterium]
MSDRFVLRRHLVAAFRLPQTSRSPTTARALLLALLALTSPIGLLPAPAAALPQAPQSAQSPSTVPADRPVPKLRSQPAILPAAAEPAAGDTTAVRLMVFSLSRQRVLDSLSVVGPLLSPRGTFELDPKNNTISVRDSLSALSRIATAIRAFDRENQPVLIDVQLINAMTAKISPIVPSIGIGEDLLVRLRQLLRFQSFSLVAHGEIRSREGETVDYDMSQGYRLSFALGSVSDDHRLRLSGFRMARSAPGAAERELVRTVVHLGRDQPLILGLTQDEASDHALLLVLRYESSAAGR